MSRKPPHLCPTKYCRNPKGIKNLVCTKCSMREWRKANPGKARFSNLRSRAARKNVPFDLTIDWLQDFLLSQGYDSTLHHIDRKVPAKGYVMGNLQVLPMSENIAKGNRERRGQYQFF